MVGITLCSRAVGPQPEGPYVVQEPVAKVAAEFDPATVELPSGRQDDEAFRARVGNAPPCCLDRRSDVQVVCQKPLVVERQEPGRLTA